MGRKRDLCWEHTKDLSTSTVASFQCNYCSGNFRGGASRIKAHLSGEGNSGIRQCPSVPRHVVEMFSRRKRASSEMENENMNSLLLCNNRPRVLEYKKNKRWVDHKIASFLTVFGISPKLVESRVFTDLIMAVAQHGSDYELPDSTTLATLRDGYIDRMWNYVTKVKGSLVDTGCTVMVTDNDVYAYSLGGQLYELGRGPLDEMHSVITTYVNSIGSTKVLQIFFNIFYTPLKKSLKNRYPWMKIGCSPTFALGRFWDCVLDLRSLGAILKTASQIAKEIDNCWIHFRVDNDHIPPYFVEDGDWEETIETLSAIWKVRQLLKYRAEGRKFIVRECIKAADYKICWADHVRRNCEMFWVQAKEWTSILQALIETLFLITSRLRPPSGYLYQIMERMRGAILECRCIDEDDINILINEFQEFQDTVKHPMYAAASLLNPANVYGERFEKHGDELKHGIDFVQDHLVEEDERAKFRNEFQRYRMKDQKIFNTTAKLALESYHPVRWWKCFGDSVPSLQKYAIQILSQPCHTPDKDGIGSKCELDGGFLPSNDYKRKQAVLMEYFGTIETEELKPIDVNNVDLPEWLDEYSTTDAFPTILLKFIDLQQPGLKKCPFCQKSPAQSGRDQVMKVL